MAVKEKFRLNKRLLTVKEYHQMAEAGIFDPDEKLELINGEIVYMSPVGSKHAHCVDVLNMHLITQIAGKAVVRVQNPLALFEGSEPEPDLAVVKGPANKYRDKHPSGMDTLLVIEVADSSLQKDREVKLPIYAEAGIPVYWIINLEEKQVEVYHSPAGKVYRHRDLMMIDDILSLESLSFQLPVKEIL